MHGFLRFAERRISSGNRRTLQGAGSRFPPLRAPEVPERRRRGHLDLIRVRFLCGGADPDVILCLGATAAQALLGKQFRVTKQRGKPVPSTLAHTVLATVHPSSVLRAPDAKARARAEREFITDVMRAAAHVERAGERATTGAARRGRATEKRRRVESDAGTGPAQDIPQYPSSQ